MFLPIHFRNLSRHSNNVRLLQVKLEALTQNFIQLDMLKDQFITIALICLDKLIPN